MDNVFPPLYKVGQRVKFYHVNRIMDTRQASFDDGNGYVDMGIIETVGINSNHWVYKISSIGNVYEHLIRPIDKMQIEMFRRAGIE